MGDPVILLALGTVIVWLFLGGLFARRRQPKGL